MAQFASICNEATFLVRESFLRDRIYVLFFIHVQTRRVHIAGVTATPDGTWMAQATRNMSMHFVEEPEESRPTHIIRDRDTKFTDEYEAILETDDIEFRPIAARSPNLNPFAERWVQSVKRECLDHFIVFGEGHLRHLLRKYLDYYHRHRPQQGLGNVLIGESNIDAAEGPLDGVICRESLGGLLKHYERRAA